jgi:hypothetical protein
LNGDYYKDWFAFMKITPATISTMKLHLPTARPGLLILMLAFVLFLLMACTAAPQIAVEPGEVELGNIAAADPVTSTLRIRNQGEGLLQINSLRTSCGCTIAEIDETTIRPGAEALMTIAFDPQAHPGLYGPLMRLIYIESNDPEQPELEIPLTVHILAPEEANQ